MHDRPKKCMNGWGEVFMIVTANGDVLPCHSARVLPNLEFPNVKDYRCKTDLGMIHLLLINLGGTHWMKEPCRIMLLRKKMI